MERQSIYKERKLNAIFKNTIKEIVDVVTMTMGPHGNTVILTNSYEGPYATKDGVSVIRALGFDDPVKDNLAKMVLEVAEETVKTAGDGTTTAICLAGAIIRVGFAELERGEQYLSLLKDLEWLEKEVLDHLNEMSETLNKTDIKDVATISANGDEAMGDIIQKAFNHSNNVKVEVGINNYDEVETVNGMILNTGYLDPAFVNVPEKDTIEYKNPLIILVDGTLHDLKDIAEPLQNPNGPILIVADAVSPNVQNILRDNYNRGALAVGLMKSPGFGGHRKSLMKDLELFTGAKMGTSWGRVDSISIGKEKSTITKKKLSQYCKARVTNLRKLAKTKAQDDLLEQRISNLTGKLSIIKVGGLTPVEVKEKYDRYDDAVLAVGSAVEEGIVAGGGQALLEVHNRFREYGVDNRFFEILLAPLNTINKN